MTPDTSNFMIAGYSFIFSVIAVYLVSLILRWRNLKRDLQTLEEMQQEK
jgi:CcmD family protein